MGHNTSRRYEIDGLRTIAVLPILLFHANLCPGGYLGVDIFFVISGYLISGIILHDLINQSFSYVKFYERRARRILPMLFFITLLCAPIAFILMGPFALKSFATSAIAVVFFVSNFWFAYQVDYYAPDAGLIPLLHTWSLGVEEQFYILWPLILTALYRFARNHILLILLLLIFCSLIISNILSYGFEAINFYLLPSRIWELSVGGLLAFCEQKFSRKSHVILTTTMPTIGLAVILLSVIFFRNGEAGPDFYTCIPVLGTAVVIWFAGQKDLGTYILQTKPLVGVGLISYSIYLWHQPILAFARIINYDELPRLVLYGFIPITIGLSYLSWRFIEQPFRNINKITNRTFLLSIIVTILLIFTIFILTSNADFSNKNFPEGFLDKIKMVKQRIGYFNLGPESNKIDFIVVGDSHLEKLYTVIDEAAMETKKSGVGVVKYACCPLKYKSTNIKNNCVKHNNKVFEYIQREKIMNVLLVFKWPSLKSDTYPLKDFKADLITTIDKYLQINAKIYIMLDTPLQTRSVLSVYTDIFAMPEELQESALVTASAKSVEYTDIQKHFISLIESYVVDNVYIVDPTNYVCNETICPLGTLEYSYYSDYHHLTVEGAKRLLPLFVDILENM